MRTDGAVHADVLAQFQAANRYMAVLLVITLLPSTAAMIVALLIPSIILRVPASGPYVFGVLLAWMAGVVPLVWYDYRRTTRKFASLGDVLRWCYVCDAWVPRRTWRPHLESQHRTEARFLRVSIYAAVGTVLSWAGIVAIVAFLGVLDILRFSPVNVDSLLLAFWTGMIAWMTCVAVYGIVFWPRHAERSRAAWQAGGRPPQP